MKGWKKFLLIFAYGELSRLELASFEESKIIDFEVISSSESGAIISCDEKSIHSIIRTLGGSYKIAQVIGNRLEDSLEQIEYPYGNKFNWTISAYNSVADLYDLAKESLRETLKRKRLGKGKFLEPNLSEEAGNVEDSRGRKELSIIDLARRVFSDVTEKGLDFVLFGGTGTYDPIFAITKDVSDVDGFEDRDFSRPFQDPTITVSPRLARLMVNLSIKGPRQKVLDPFCGLGTILQEALCQGHSVIGVDRSSLAVRKATTNLHWCRRKFRTSPSQEIRIFRYDATRLNQRIIPNVDCIATEPILLPTFKTNPKPSEIQALIGDSQEKYRSALRTIPNLLQKPWSRIVISSPIVVTSDGREHSFQLDGLPLGEFKDYRPKSFETRFKYPLQVETTKKKIVKRAITVLELEH